MEESEEHLNSILSLYEEHSDTIDFHKILNSSQEWDGSIEDLKDYTTYEVDKILLLREIKKYNKNIEKYINDNNSILFDSMLGNEKFKKFEKELSELKNEKEATERFLRIKIDFNINLIKNINTKEHIYIKEL